MRRKKGPFLKIIEAAGLQPWPKLIQNLRASCENDWLDSGMPAHVVARWIGHTVKVQNDHYVKVDDHHFDRFNEQVAHQVAHKPCETARSGKNGEGVVVGLEQGKTNRAIKKHGFETVPDALERSRTSTPITGT